MTVAIAVAVAAGPSCYKPQIADGGLLCNAHFLPDCPDGFHCLGGRCRRVGADAAVQPMVDAGPEGPVADGPSDTHDAVATEPDAACFAPVAGCTVDKTHMCDPVCQSGCTGCHQKCSVNTAGTVTCNAPLTTLARDEGQSCTPASEGTPVQTDDCKPGLVCFDENCGSLCVRFCRVDGDCPNSTCTRQLPGGLKGCDVPPTTCNPVMALGVPNCPALAQGCYLSTSQTDKTFCDCPSNDQAPGMPCNDSRDCVRRAHLRRRHGGTDFRCHVTCTLVGPTSGCDPTQTCHPLGNNTKLGYCN